ncbi:MAG: hypothetical protein ACTSX9_00565 [Candidatus Njordarchaeales archaeon]
MARVFCTSMLVLIQISWHVDILLLIRTIPEKELRIFLGILELLNLIVVLMPTMEGLLLGVMVTEPLYYSILSMQISGLSTSFVQFFIMIRVLTINIQSIGLIL